LRQRMPIGWIRGPRTFGAPRRTRVDKGCRMNSPP
jgi:hypothetical protein